MALIPIALGQLQLQLELIADIMPEEAEEPVKAQVPEALEVTVAVDLVVLRAVVIPQ